MAFPKLFGFSGIILVILLSYQLQGSVGQYYGVSTTLEGQHHGGSSTSEGQTVRRTIHTNLVPVLPNLFSQAIQVDNMVYVSGYIGIDINSNLATGIRSQTIRTLTNIGHILEAAKSSLNKVVQVTVKLSNLANSDAMNAVYVQFFTDAQALPARSVYEVSALPLGALVEIEVVAIAGAVKDAN